MSHDTHQQPQENKTIISFKNSFWLVIIIVGLFIAALNFIKAESAGESEGHEGGHEKTEMKAHEGAAGGHEQKAEEHHEAETKPADTAKAVK